MRLALVGLLIFLSTACCAMEQHEIAKLLSQIEVVRDKPVRFRERRMNPMLSEPLVLEGVVRFSTQGAIYKTIQKPFSESVMISQSTVRLERAGKVRSTALEDNQSLRLLYITLRGLLEGDAAALERYFQMDAVARGEAWKLTLTPVTGELREFMAQMDVSGVGGRLVSVLTILSDDNWQQMLFPIAESP